MENNQQYKYYAYIILSYKNWEWGKRLQRELEKFRIPASLCSQHGWKRKPINSILVFPYTNGGIGGFHAGLKGRIEDSRHLVIVCSSNSVKSVLASKEIAYFHSIGRSKNIYLFIVDGIPDSGDSTTECFTSMAKEFGVHETQVVNIHENIYRWPWLNRKRVYMQLISTLLGIEFDYIWQRYKRRAIQKLTVTLVVSIITASLLLLHWLGVKGL